MNTRPASLCFGAAGRHSGRLVARLAVWYLLSDALHGERKKGFEHMNKAIVGMLVFALVVAAALLVPARGQQGYKSVRIVYHSDTRGYHQPCG